MSYPIDATIPLGTHDPSDDVPLMRNNFSNIKSYLSVDHVPPGDVGNGYHKFINFNNVVVPPAQTNPQGLLHTQNVGASGAPDLIWKNSKGIFPVSMIRAFGAFTGSTGVAIGNTWNCTTARNAAGNYTISLTLNAVTGSNYSVLVTSTMASNFGTGAIIGYDSPTSAGFNIFARALTSAAGADPTSISFVVLQF